MLGMRLGGDTGAGLSRRHGGGRTLLAHNSFMIGAKEISGYVDLALSKSYIAPLFFKMAQNLDLRCVLVPAPWVLGPKHVSIRPRL